MTCDAGPESRFNAMLDLVPERMAGATPAQLWQGWPESALLIRGFTPQAWSLSCAAAGPRPGSPPSYDSVAMD